MNHFDLNAPVVDQCPSSLRRLGDANVMIPCAEEKALCSVGFAFAWDDFFGGHEARGKTNTEL